MSQHRVRETGIILLTLHPGNDMHTNTLVAVTALSMRPGSPRPVIRRRPA